MLDEQQVYRIDHFLGKEATQDLHVLRFANDLFAAMWNREHVESVQIDVPEKLGITDRAGFYDATGAVLDMLVTHLFQVAAEVAMEPPATLGPLDLQAAREKVISCFRPLDPSDVVLGQFDGYRDVPGIAADSTRDTYVAARLWIDNDRWRGVPFYLRTGKRLAATEQQVSLILREPSGPLAGQLPADTNVLSFSLAGNGEIGLSLMAKKPGPALELESAQTSIPLANLKGADPLPPYVRLIHDVLLGDRSLFTRPDGLAAVWDVAGPLLANPPKVAPYAQGSWGPAEARELIAPGTLAAGPVRRPGVLEDQLLVDRPGWLDWPWALRVLDREVRVTGEEVRPAEGMVATACLVADEPVVITVTGGESQLTVKPSAPAPGEFVARRFHLDLDETAVDVALEKSTFAGLFERDGWVRRPAAAMLWSYCLVFLCGGDPDASPVQRIFAELGRPAGHLRLPPDPADLLTAGERRIVGYGVAPHRAANVVGLARAFAANPDRYDEVALRALPGDEAIARVAELPHIGATRPRRSRPQPSATTTYCPTSRVRTSNCAAGWARVAVDTGGRAPRRAVPQRSG